MSLCIIVLHFIIEIIIIYIAAITNELHVFNNVLKRANKQNYN